MPRRRMSAASVIWRMIFFCYQNWYSWSMATSGEVVHDLTVWDLVFPSWKMVSHPMACSKGITSGCTMLSRLSKSVRLPGTMQKKGSVGHPQPTRRHARFTTIVTTLNDSGIVELLAVIDGPWETGFVSEVNSGTVRPAGRLACR